MEHENDNGYRVRQANFRGNNVSMEHRQFSSHANDEHQQSRAEGKYSQGKGRRDASNERFVPANYRGNENAEIEYTLHRMQVTMAQMEEHLRKIKSAAKTYEIIAGLALGIAFVKGIEYLISLL